MPDASRYYSLLAEVSHSEFKPVNRDTVVEDTIRGMINTKLLSESDRKDIVDAFLIERDYTYPTPSLERDAALKVLHPWLESRDIYSRGRFGAWRYEVGNMDHSVAQGEPHSRGRPRERVDVSREAGLLERAGRRGAMRRVVSGCSPV